MPIQVLVAMDYWYSLLGPKVSKTIPLSGNLVVHCTPVGNILAGSLDLENTQLSNDEVSMFCETQEEITKLWEMDTIGIRDDPICMEKQNEKQENLLQRFNETTIFENGRYYVEWPWKTNNPVIATNYGSVKYRLQQTVNTLIAKSGVDDKLKTYDNIIQDQLKRGIIEPVQNAYTATGPLVHYIAHFPVIKEDKKTTKVRIVYDASAKAKPNRQSLNDLIYTGVNFLEDLVGLLIRFRIPRFALISDIEKAFLQVGLKEQDRDSARFLWLKDPSQSSLDANVQIYRFTRIPFGVTASPYLLLATIHHHLEKNPGPIAESLKRNIYMDNVFQGAESTRECYDIYVKTKALFKKASMNLREWSSNNVEFINCIPSLDAEKSEVVKVLGINWNTRKDEIAIRSITVDEQQVVTKRYILHQMAKVYDPLGIVAPVLIRGKILFQELWKLGVDWDDEVSLDHREQWQQIEQDFPKLDNLSLPRRFLSGENCHNSLVCFTDASPSACAAVVYLRTERDQDIKTSFVFAKARVVPLKPMLTIPKLEHLGVVIGTRLLQYVEKQIEIPIESRILWTDSQIVLHWLSSEKLPSSYAKRRIEEIKAAKRKISFRYVPSKGNSADIATRGCCYKEMAKSTWLQGPVWLSNSESAWPSWQHNDIVDSCFKNGNTTEQKESSKQILLQAPSLCPTLNDGPFGIETNNYSTLGKLIRVTAYCRRFISQLRHLPIPRTAEITAEEIIEAKQQWIECLQTDAYKDTVQNLTKGKRTKIAKQLDLYVDHKILRCGGRLINADIGWEAKFPALLPKNTWFTLV